MPDETKQGAQDALPGKGQPSGAADGTTPIPAPETFTKEQHEKLLSDALAKAGREHADTRRQLAAATATIEANKVTLTELDETIKTMKDTDPDKFNLVEARKKLRADITALEARQAASQEIINSAQEITQFATCMEIAGEFQGADPVRLDNAAKKFKVTDEAGIRELAATLWTTAPATAPAKPAATPTPFPGGTQGGGDDLSTMTPREKIEAGLKKAKEKQ